ncbi:GNAT family N-acetyltransferase [Paenarthrobacter sp. PH39-S1]|uniref:GNAT family N-acetyltransferase n=1 Tax=Micrococcaceae TaxID=1268 RepID=UPI0024BAABEE|nr:GNAT family N-acetyltransferase [Paenarthrobacter sp. PH39-S1]MDJ0355025.1 GNAT family N-acetyltransferase [Paenarthrobacter sp. PH39-S1]
MAVFTTDRLMLDEMTNADLDEVAALLGDPFVMRYYAAPRDRAGAQRWIDWNSDNYRAHGFGLWKITTHDGGFVGDCGLTVQTVDGVQEVEIGYHVRAEMQRRGYATEAARRCVDFAREREIRRIIAIVHPDNLPSQKVAGNLGLTLERQTVDDGGAVQLIFGRTL